MKQKYIRIPMPVRYAINTVLLAAFLLVMNYFISIKMFTTSNVKVIMLIGINILLAVSLNVATGYLGQLPLGHAGFMAVGGYSSAILMKYMGSASLGAMLQSAGFTKAAAESLIFPLGMLFGGVMAALFGLAIGIPALRLKGDYLAIITLGFGEIIRVVILNIDSVLGFKLTYGAASLKYIPKTTTFLNTFTVVILSCFLIHTMMKSRHGRAILAIRENEIAAESCGIKTTHYKTLGFVASAFFTGVAGSLYAGYLGLLSPGSFGFMKSIEILVIVVLGGMGSMAGSVISAAVLTALPQFLLAFDKWRMVIYSLVLVIVMIFKPSGLMGNYDFSLSRILEKTLGRLPVGKPEPEKGGTR